MDSSRPTSSAAKSGRTPTGNYARDFEFHGGSPKREAEIEDFANTPAADAPGQVAAEFNGPPRGPAQTTEQQQRVVNQTGPDSLSVTLRSGHRSASPPHSRGHGTDSDRGRALYSVERQQSSRDDVSPRPHYSPRAGEHSTRRSHDDGERRAAYEDQAYPVDRSGSHSTWNRGNDPARRGDVRGRGRGRGRGGGNNGRGRGYEPYHSSSSSSSHYKQQQQQRPSSPRVDRSPRKRSRSVERKRPRPASPPARSPSPSRDRSPKRARRSINRSPSPRAPSPVRPPTCSGFEPGEIVPAPTGYADIMAAVLAHMEQVPANFALIGEFSQLLSKLTWKKK